MAGDGQHAWKQCRGSGRASFKPTIVIWVAGPTCLYCTAFLSIWELLTWFHAVCIQGPTISPVFCKRDGKVAADYFAIVICVPKKALYKSVQQLRMVRNYLLYHSICQHLLMHVVVVD